MCNLIDIDPNHPDLASVLLQKGVVNIDQVSVKGSLP
jgi:hypothetical protein